MAGGSDEPCGLLLILAHLRASSQAVHHDQQTSPPDLHPSKPKIDSSNRKIKLSF